MAFQSKGQKSDFYVLENEEKKEGAPSSSTTNSENNKSKDEFNIAGKQLRSITGITKAPGELHFLCKFTDDSAALLPIDVVQKRWPTHAIRFYESQLDVRDLKF